MPKKILIIDDDLDIIEVLSIQLEANGYDVVSVTDTAEVLAVVAKERPDLVFLDVIFPENSTAGFEICRDLKNDENLRSIPVIIFSAINERFALGISSGEVPRDWVPADLFLEKPVDPELLSQVLATFEKTGTLSVDSLLDRASNNG